MFEQETKGLEQRIAAIQAKYQPEIERLTAEGEAISDEEMPSDVGAVIGVDIQVEWKDTDVSFDLPEVTVHDKSFSLDLPEITMSTKEISFGIPDVRMVDKKVGQYPEIHGFTVKWKDIIISVPEPYIRQVKISFDIPEVAMRRQDFVIGIPEFTMKTVRWILSLPQFSVVNVSAQTEALAEKGRQLKARGEEIATRMRAEIENEVQAFRQAIGLSKSAGATETAASYDSALNSISNAISGLQAQGVDPIKVPTQSGDINLRKMYEQLLAQKATSLAAFDAV